MKGVNPLVAIILLIVFCIAIGGLLAWWLASYQKSYNETINAINKTEMPILLNQTYYGLNSSITLNCNCSCGVKNEI